ncbi:MAG: glycosyltransferase family A protein [Ilumatobacteraceae bacterium]
MCTRNRGRRVRSTVASVLRNDWPFELIVIDQSDDDVTYEGLTSLLDDPRLRYIRSRERGLSRSRNLGIAEARHELIIMTDDDCVVPPSFVQTMVEELTMGERVAMVFADVVEPVSSDLHWTPTNEAHSDYTVSAVRGWKSNDGVNIGIGAAMGFRKSVVLGVGGFDEQLGAGARYHSAEDTDIVLRLLLRHHRVHRTTRTWVDHLGARTVSETRNVIHGAMFGMAVASGKLIRHRQWEVVPYFLGVAWLMVIKVGVLEIINGRRPPVLGRSRQLVGGLIEGLRHPGDRSTLLFRPLEPEVPPSSP